MKKGTIFNLKHDQGTIISENGEKVVFLYSVLSGIRSNELRQSMAVEYEDTKNRKTLEATVVRAAPSAGSGAAQGGNSRTERRPQPQNTGRRSDNQFLNPYNFVRFLPFPYDQDSIDQELDETVFDADAGKIGQALLGKCPPPGHDRYVALSGRIECVAENVTPLFVSDAHEIRVGERKHRSYRFFRYDGKKALPAAGLRGMARSVFEAATNSCLAVFNGEHKLSYHYPAEETFKLVPARVEEKDGQLMLRLLPGTTNINTGQRPRVLYAAWVRRYTWGNPNNAAGNHYANRPTVNIDPGWDVKKPLYALLERARHPSGRFNFWNVKGLSPDRKKLPEPDGGNNQKIAKGWLYITNRNIGKKHDERFSFRDEAANRNIPELLPIDNGLKESWFELIRDYQERHRKDIEKRRKEGRDPGRAYGGREMAFSSYILSEKCRLGDGDLLYAILKEENGRLMVEHLVPASVPRVAHDDRVEDLSPKHLSACRDYNRLCPACRVFGWVRGDGDKTRETGDGQAEQKPPESERVAYKGRLRFHHGELVEDKGSFEVSLAILSSPKPTTTRFYLIKKGGETLDGLAEGDCGYKKSLNRLRGRKFYRHHSQPVREEYERKGAPARNDEQNRTVRDALNKGCRFKFAIDFENLAEVELGALLWSLEIRGCCHRLGYAKPLGFGSLKIEVGKLTILDLKSRYSSIDDPGEKTIGRDIWQKWVRSFKSAMLKKYASNGEFEKLPNIEDLRNLLGETQPGTAIHYPRTTPYVTEEGRNFEWFIGNKKGPKLALPYPGDDTLPIIDRNGNIRSS